VVAVVGVDIRVTVEEHEAFAADVTLVEQNASGLDGDRGREAVDPTELAVSAIGKECDIKEAAEPIGWCGDEVHSGSFRPGLRVECAGAGSTLVRRPFDCGGERISSKTYDRAVQARGRAV